MRRFSIPLAVLAVGGTAAGAAGFTPTFTNASSSPTSSSLSVATALQNTYANVYRQVSPSVVQIQTSEGLGSGIVFDSKGDIVTNNHVVGTAKTFLVTTSNGRGKQLKGTLVGTFPADDLAVIHVAGGGLKPARFANSDRVRIGDIAMAIGNPLGLSSSFTEGIVSGLNRQEPEGNGVVLASAIQTSAAINPGNSGGALVNIKGEVIGIPTLAAEDPQLGGAASGIGFAIPSNAVTRIASQLVATGKVTNSGRAYLGVSIADTGAATGAYLTEVQAGTAAAKAGLKVGELITALAGAPTPTSTELGTVLAGLKPGQTVSISISSSTGQKRTTKITLGEYPGG